MRNKIITIKDFNIAGVQVPANTEILEFISLENINFINPVNIETLRKIPKDEIVFSFLLKESEIEDLFKHYDKYHDDNIAMQLLEEIKEFNVVQSK